MLQFHKAGGLARWHDRARSTQWCSDAVEFPMGSYLYEMPGGKQLPGGGKDDNACRVVISGRV